MTGEVVLSAALRSNLLSLQRTQGSIDKVQNILATGLKVSSALDNPQSFFASQALKNRSSDLTRLLDGIGQSIQTIKAADAGVSSLTKLVEQASSIVDQAREAVTNGAKEAAITGNKSLKGVTDLGTVPGILPGDDLEFAVRRADGVAVTLSNPGDGAGIINIASGDSIEQLITKINDLTDATGTSSPTNGQQVLEASLTSDGKLKIKALHGYSFGLTFNSAGASGSAQDVAFAAALGFGEIAKSTPTGGGNTAIEVTAVATTKLMSGVFHTSAATQKATASTLLTNVRTTDGGATSRFQMGASATDALSIDITINDRATVGLSMTSTSTVQSLVDAINTDTSLNQFIRAEYDDKTGQFSIEAISSQVQTIKIAANENPATGPGTSYADFDFGVDDQYMAGGAGGSEGETFVLSAAASVLSQYEEDYNTLLSQIDELVQDAGYRGVNLLAGDTLDTFFNEDRSNKLSTKGSQLDSAGLGLKRANFARIETIEAAGTEVRASLSSLRSFGGTLSNSLSIIQTREDFTKNLVSTLNEGSDKLTLADQNEEGAKLLALQTRQQLGVTALSLAAQAQQSVLRLF